MKPLNTTDKINHNIIIIIIIIVITMKMINISKHFPLIILEQHKSYDTVIVYNLSLLICAAVPDVCIL